MADLLFNLDRQPLYCTRDEVNAFLCAAQGCAEPVKLYCYVLALTGCRVSEALELTRHHFTPKAIIFRTLKKRHKLEFRSVPIPHWFFRALFHYSRHFDKDERLFPFSRTYSYMQIKQVFKEVGMTGANTSGKALRHSFAVNHAVKGTPMHVIQKWLGHSNPQSTARYSNATGDEEHSLAKIGWGDVPALFSTTRTK